MMMSKSTLDLLLEDVRKGGEARIELAKQIRKGNLSLGHPLADLVYCLGFQLPEQQPPLLAACHHLHDQLLSHQGEPFLLLLQSKRHRDPHVVMDREMNYWSVAGMVKGGLKPIISSVDCFCAIAINPPWYCCNEEAPQQHDRALGFGLGCAPPIDNPLSFALTQQLTDKLDQIWVGNEAIEANLTKLPDYPASWCARQHWPKLREALTEAAP
jgi:hypothetical protein